MVMVLKHKPDHITLPLRRLRCLRVGAFPPPWERLSPALYFLLPAPDTLTFSLGPSGSLHSASVPGCPFLLPPRLVPFHPSHLSLNVTSSEA